VAGEGERQRARHRPGRTRAARSSRPRGCAPARAGSPAGGDEAAPPRAPQARRAIRRLGPRASRAFSSAPWPGQRWWRPTAGLAMLWSPCGRRQRAHEPVNLGNPRPGLWARASLREWIDRPRPIDAAPPDSGCRRSISSSASSSAGSIDGAPRPIDPARARSNPSTSPAASRSSCSASIGAPRGASATASPASSSPRCKPRPPPTAPSSPGRQPDARREPILKKAHSAWRLPAGWRPDVQATRAETLSHPARSSS
jgi:hypothetical protein